MFNSSALYKIRAIAPLLGETENCQRIEDEIEDLRIDAIAAERAASFDPTKAIPLDVMLKKYGVE